MKKLFTFIALAALALGAQPLAATDRKPLVAVGPKVQSLPSGDMLLVTDDAYDATGWNGSSQVPTKNAVRDKIETLSAGGLLAANNLSDVANVGTSRTNLGVGTGDSPEFSAINLGHASDTTITRTGAGDAAIEGNALYRAGGTDVPVTDGGTGASTAGGAATNLGLGTGDSPQFTAINIGHASDTTLARASAGNLTVEGNALYRAGGTDVPLADGGTGASLADPNADRIAFWDDSAGAIDWLVPSTGLSISGTNLTVDATAVKPTESIIVAASDESTLITTGTSKVTFRMPYAFTVTDVRVSVNTAPTGSTILVDINEGGTTIISTKLMIDASEKTSTTAATPAVISDSSLADDAEMTIDFDQVGSTIAGKGVKVTIIGRRS